MKTLIQIFKTKAVIIFLAALATVTIFLFFWAKNRKTAEVTSLPTLSSPTIESHPLTIKPQISELKGKFTNFPKELPVYQIDSPKFLHNQALTIANDLGFQEAPQISQDVRLGPIYNWSSGVNYLSITTDQGSVNYSLNLLDNPKILEGELASLEEIKIAAQSFLENQIIPLPQGLNLAIKRAQYLKQSGPVYLSTDSLSEADVAQIDFEFKIESFEILSAMPGVPPLSLKIGPKMQIVRIDYQSPFGQLGSDKTYPLKTEKEVLENLEAMPRISGLQLPLFQYFSTDTDYQKIQSVEYQEVSLGYYRPLVSEEYLHPVFLISGTAQLMGGEKGEVYLFLPAVAEKYFTPEP